METILVFDVGLTNAKTVVFSPAGEVLAQTAVPYPSMTPRRGWLEHDPEAWWAALLSGLKKVRHRSPGLVDGVAAISVTGHMHSLVPVDGRGDPLAPALVLGDGRGEEEAEALIAGEGQAYFYNRSGARLDASMPLVKIRWLQKHQPGLCARVAHWLSCKDFLRARLTGDRFTDPLDATGMALFDLRTGQWSDELCAAAGIHRDQLPVVSTPATVAGLLREVPAKALGLPSGLPVVVGAGDDIEVLGFGLCEPGLALEHFGTTGSIIASTAEPCFDEAGGVEVYPHLLPGLWLHGGSISAAGAARAWAANVLAGGDHSRPILPGKESGEAAMPLFLPHLQGARCPDWSASARGAWLGLSSAHGPEELFQAVMEGCSFALRAIADRMEEKVGLWRELRVSPHSGEDAAWRVMRASIYGRNLWPLESADPTALGAMMPAAVALGHYPDLATASRTLARAGERVRPDEAAREVYSERYQNYRRANALLLQFHG